MPSAIVAQSQPRNRASVAAGNADPAAPICAAAPPRPASPAEIGELAHSAMLAELSATPKPGLVDQQDCGSHRDMGPDTLVASAAAIRPFLERIAADASGAPAAPATLEAARRIGLAAEHAMFAATEGINTHKGQIFVLVTLICSAMCRSGALSPLGEQEQTRFDAWRAAVQCLTKGMVERELACLGTFDAVSNGERLYVAYGLSGVRGEAQNGFPSIFDVGLPTYRTMLHDGYSANDAAVHALLAIMTVAEDTTVVHRGRIEALAFVRWSAAQAIARGGLRTADGRAYLDHMNAAFIDRGLSAGGCADLLAGTIFVHAVAEAYGGRQR